MGNLKLSRLKISQGIRDLVSESGLSIQNFVLPYFVVEGRGVVEPINSLPGINRLSVDRLLKDIEKLRGIRAVLLFGIPRTKSQRGEVSFKDNGIIQRAVKEVKRRFPQLIVITDLCLCGYTSHGHCGIVKNARIDSAATLKALAKIALSHARSGADFVAPSAMADGQVRAIRQALDKNTFETVGILAYSAKFASGFYGPFREAVDSAPRFGDRRSYQLDYRNSNQALREIEEDINEGVDIVMVKPALPYLDVIYRAKQKFNIPIAAYNVSGEYSLIKKLSQADKNKERELALEVLGSIKRAGADLIISYFAKELSKWINH